MLTLLDIPLSPYAQKIKLALLEKGIAFESRIPDLNAPDAEFLRHSPRLEVPALIDGEVGLFDSTIILEYIEDRWPEAPLLPKTPAERARVRMLEEICDTAYDAVVWGAAEIAIFKRAEGALADAMLQTARKQVEGLNARLQQDLQGRTYFNGETFGFGDVVSYPFVNGAAALGMRPAPGSPLEAWWKSVRKRPSAERLKQDILASLPDFMRKPEEVATGKHRRQYRDHRVDWMLRSGGVQIVLEGMQKNSIRFSSEF